MRAIGKDATIVVQKGAEILLEIRRVRNWSWTPGLEELTDDYQGELNTDVAGVNSYERFELETVPDGSGYLRLASFQQLKNDGDPASKNIKISVTFMVEHGDGDVAKRILPDCTVTGGVVSSGGRAEYMTQALTFICSRGRNLGASA